MRPVWIVDTETTRIEPDYVTGSGVIWELGLIEYGTPEVGPDRSEYLWRMRPDLAKADETALAVGRFYERTETTRAMRMGDRFNLTELDPGEPPVWSDPGDVAYVVARMLAGATLVASAAHFDAGYLRAYLRHHGEAAAWDHQLRDVCSMAYGCLKGQQRVTPPFGARTAEYATALGVDVTLFEAHTALGDCRLNAAMLDVINGEQ